MLRYSILFFVLSLLAGVFGFSEIAIVTTGIARVLFFIFLVLFVATLALHFLRNVEDTIDFDNRKF